MVNQQFRERSMKRILGYFPIHSAQVPECSQFVIRSVLASIRYIPCIKSSIPKYPETAMVFPSGDQEKPAQGRSSTSIRFCCKKSCRDPVVQFLLMFTAFIKSFVSSYMILSPSGVQANTSKILSLKISILIMLFFSKFNRYISISHSNATLFPSGERTIPVNELPREPEVPAVCHFGVPSG